MQICVSCFQCVDLCHNCFFPVFFLFVFHNILILKFILVAFFFLHINGVLIILIPCFFSKYIACNNLNNKKDYKVKKELLWNASCLPLDEGLFIREKWFYYGVYECGVLFTFLQRFNLFSSILLLFVFSVSVCVSFFLLRLIILQFSLFYWLLLVFLLSDFFSVADLTLSLATQQSARAENNAFF